MKQIFRSKFTITQKFGVNPEYYGKFGLKGHEGLDLIPTGSDWTVYALEDGVVVRDEDNKRSGSYGVYVTLWHAQSKKATQYCHLELNLVDQGMQVKKGQAIGKMGSTGNSTGPHLHLNLFNVDDSGVRLNRDNGFLGGIDPEPYLNEDDTQAVIDELRKARDTNWNLYQAEVKKREVLEKRVEELEGRVRPLEEENLGLKTQISEVTNANAVLAEQLKKKNEEDATAIDTGLDAQNDLKEVRADLEAVAHALETGPKLGEMLSRIDELRKPDEVVVKEHERLGEALFNLAKKLTRKPGEKSFIEKLLDRLLRRES